MAQRRSKQSASAKADRALSIARTLQASREKKFNIVDFLVSVDSDGEIYTLNDVAVGTSDSSRNGDRIHCTRLRFNFWRTLPGSASGRFSVRFLVIIDKQNTIENVDQIFFGLGTNYCPFVQFVKDYRKQFVVIYDSQPNHMDQYNKGTTSRCDRGLNLHTQFLQGTDAITTGAIKLIVLSNVGTAANNKPLLIGSARVDYTDA